MATIVKRVFLIPALLITGLAQGSRASESANLQAAAESVLERYASVHKQSEAWAVETIQIDAELPRLSKRGGLRAIRRLIPLGRPHYQIVESSGDQMVKQQVIARYLTLDRQAAETPAASVAITTDNYKFRFKSIVETAQGHAYTFAITPRKKRAGLIKGELWLDSETGIPVRLAGYFVKAPSIFIKRIEMTRDLSIRDGAIQARTTRLSIRTRLVGAAEVQVIELPHSEFDDLKIARDQP